MGGGLSLPDFKIYYVSSNKDCGVGGGIDTEINGTRIENLDIEPYKHAPLIFDKNAKVVQQW